MTARPAGLGGEVIATGEKEVLASRNNKPEGIRHSGLTKNQNG